jgi:hypothetical protein
MHSRCLKALTCLSARSQPSSGCGSGKPNGERFLATRTRSFSGPSPSTTPNNHRRFVRNKTVGRSAILPRRLDHGLDSDNRVMEFPAEFATFSLYDWRTSAPNTQLHYIRTEDQANECIARINSRPGILTIGVDFEWRPNFAAGKPENPIALVQIACDDEILLVQVSAMQGTVGPPVAPTRYSADSIIRLSHQTSRSLGVAEQCKSWGGHPMQVTTHEARLFLSMF